ncbi:MAG: LSU ribosomal protein L6p (L9e) [Cytophagales bacterium]|jgi:large subunit ribosomal protein L6|nr:50S ribosomal protein L6 [Bacteroidota bacterium]MBS1980473.1 50S ribosomal protein L6 [Bacteroidota bacterium]WHZ07789.1 MAG: LSU ribosomal protein L6p (L9e) [Cytophagales bacterium]
MSRIGRLPISLPNGVSCTFSEAEHKVTVKGPKGELKQQLDPDFKISLEEGKVMIQRPTEQKRHKAMHGLYRSLIANMVEGVSKGYRRELEVIGVGYKATAQGNVLDLSLGFSHSVIVAIPSELKLQAVQEKGQNPMIILEGMDKQLIGQVAAKIKSLRPVEPYKGKGIRYVGEFVRRKAGKAAAKA